MENTEFKWTNELIFEFVNFYNEKCKQKPTWTSEALDEFLKSKQPVKQVLFITEDGYNVVENSTTIYIGSNYENWNANIWETNAAACSHGNPKIKYFLKKENRDKWVEENIPKKSNYEILSFLNPGCDPFKPFFIIDNDGYYSHGKYFPLYTSEQLLISKYPIYSVRRNSDGEIFTIGDTIELFGDYPTGIIDKFDIDYFDNTKISAYNNCGYGKGLVACKKVAPKVCVFTTDKVDYFYNDPYFRVFKDFTYSANVALEVPDEDHLDCAVFPTKQLAEDYIFMNKPVLISFDELHNYSMNTMCYSKFFIEFFRNKTLGK